MDRSFRSGDELWQVLRVGTAFSNDPDWVNDVSQGVPAEAICGSVQFNARGGQRGKNTVVEFIVVPYLASSGVVQDLAGETFTYQPIFVHDVSYHNRPKGSNVTGNGVSEEVATCQVAAASAEFMKHYRFDCDGADRFTIRMTSFSGAPGSADEWEIWYRPVVE